jgi:hypothetical protein
MLQLFCPQRKNLKYPLDGRLSGPQSWYGHGGEKFLVPVGSQTCHPAHSLFTVLTGLFLFLFQKFCIIIIDFIDCKLQLYSSPLFCMNCVTVSHFERAVELSIDVLQ